MLEFDADTGDDADGAETAANELAAETLLRAELNQKILDSPRSELDAVAEEAGVHVAIVAGRRGHLTGGWKAVAKLRPGIDTTELERAATEALAV